MRKSPGECYTSSIVAAIVQWQNAALWQRMSWVRNPLAAPKNLYKALFVGNKGAESMPLEDRSMVEFARAGASCAARCI